MRRHCQGWVVLCSSPCRCRMRGVAFGAGGYGPRCFCWTGGQGMAAIGPQILRLPITWGGGSKGWTDEGVAGPLPQARQVRGGPQGRARTRSLPLTDARWGLLFPP